MSKNTRSHIDKSLQHLNKSLIAVPPMIEFKGWPLHAFEYPSQVLPNVWISGIAFDDDLPKWCYENKFTHILNACGSYGRIHYYKTHPLQYGIQYLELDIEDVPTVELAPFLGSVYKFLLNAFDFISPGFENKILVHCIWGQSRSASCILYFIMKRWKINYDVALSLIRKTRSTIRPNSGFETQLRTMNFT